MHGFILLVFALFMHLFIIYPFFDGDVARSRVDRWVFAAAMFFPHWKWWRRLQEENFFLSLFYFCPFNFLISLLITPKMKSWTMLASNIFFLHNNVSVKIIFFYIWHCWYYRITSSFSFFYFFIETFRGPLNV